MEQSPDDLSWEVVTGHGTTPPAQRSATVVVADNLDSAALLCGFSASGGIIEPVVSLFNYGACAFSRARSFCFVRFFCSFGVDVVSFSFP